MERPPSESTNQLENMVRIVRRPHGNLVYHSSSNEWAAYNDHYLHEPVISAENSAETMEVLEGQHAARNSSMPIRPYTYHYQSDRAVQRNYINRVVEIRQDELGGGWDQEYSDDLQ